MPLSYNLIRCERSFIKYLREADCLLSFDVCKQLFMDEYSNMLLLFVGKAAITLIILNW